MKSRQRLIVKFFVYLNKRRRIMKKATLIVLCGIVSLVIGFFIGRSSIDSEPKKEYIKGETVTGSVSSTQFKPIKEEKPNIQYRDTASIKYLSIPVDTSAIIADWELKRTYKLTAFDNKTHGKLDSNITSYQH